MRIHDVILFFKCLSHNNPVASIISANHARMPVLNVLADMPTFGPSSCFHGRIPIHFSPVHRPRLTSPSPPGNRTWGRYRVTTTAFRWLKALVERVKLAHASTVVGVVRSKGLAGMVEVAFVPLSAQSSAAVDFREESHDDDVHSTGLRVSARYSRTRVEKRYYRCSLSPPAQRANKRVIRYRVIVTTPLFKHTCPHGRDRGRRNERPNAELWTKNPSWIRFTAPSLSNSVRRFCGSRGWMGMIPSTTFAPRAWTTEVFRGREKRAAERRLLFRRNAGYGGENRKRNFRNLICV